MLFVVVNPNTSCCSTPSDDAIFVPPLINDGLSLSLIRLAAALGRALFCSDPQRQSRVSRVVAAVWTDAARG